MAPSAYWGMEQIWDTKFDNHNAMFDAKGRLWLTGTNHAPGTPAFCRKGSDNPYAKVFPLDKNERQLAMFDPKTQKFTFIDTCFGTHHLQFGFDKRQHAVDQRRRPRGRLARTPRCSTRPATPRRRRAGRRSCSTPTATASSTSYTEPGQPIDPNKDMR